MQNLKETIIRPCANVEVHRHLVTGPQANVRDEHIQAMQDAGAFQGGQVICLFAVCATAKRLRWQSMASGGGGDDVARI